MIDCKSEVESGRPIAKVANHRCNLGFIKKLPAVGFMHEITWVFTIFCIVIFAARSNALTPCIASSAQSQIERCKYPLQANLDRR